MAMKFSTAVRDGRANSIEATIGASAILRIRTGAAPTAPADADTGTVLAEMALPASYLTSSSSGVILKDGTWQDPAANAAGTAGHFRLYDSTGTTCHIQGTITGTGGGGDMTLDNVSIEVDQQVTITGFTITDGNA